MTIVKGDEKAQGYYRLLVSHCHAPQYTRPPRMSVVSLQMQSPWEGRREAPTPGLSRNIEH